MRPSSTSTICSRMDLWASRTGPRSLSPVLLRRHSTTRFAAVGGEIDGQAFGAEGLADLPDEAREIDIGHVDFVDDDGAREVQIAGHVHDAAGDDFDAADGADDQGDGFDGGEAADGLAEQIWRAGRVDEIDARALVIGMEEMGVDGMAVFFFLFFKIAEAGAVGDGGGSVDGAGGEQQRIDKGGLSRAAVARDENVSNISSGVVRHDDELLAKIPADGTCGRCSGSIRTNGGNKKKKIIMRRRERRSWRYRVGAVGALVATGVVAARLGRDDLPASFELNGVRYRIERTIKHDFWAATGFYTDAEGRRVVLKVGRTIDYAAIPFRPVGRWLCRREMGFFQRLADVPNVPRLLGRVSDTGFVHDYVPGRPMGDFKALSGEFFEKLTGLMRDVHQRGIAYVDSNKSSNILVGDDGEPHLIDFQISVRESASGAWPWRQIVRRLQVIDMYHIAKHKKRLCPEC